ncbi:MAG: hypothetical protein WCK51_15555 [Armatimonadota bacterium]
MKKVIALFAVVGVVAASTFQAEAKPPFAAKEKKACNYCHLTDAGGARGFRGIYYGANKLSLKKFVEKAQAKKAGVKEGAVGAESKPTKPYTGK